MEVLRQRTSAKWTAYPPDVLPMFVAEMDYALAPAIRQALHEALDRGDTGYVNPARNPVFAAFASFAQESWGWTPEHMRITTDVSVVVVESLRALISPGDGVIITPPVYPPFYDMVTEAGGSVVEVPLRDNALDLPGIDAALTAGAKAVLLCSPHNPLGLVHTRDGLTELAAIVERHGAYVVSDEIHAPLTHPGTPFTPYLTVSDAARQHGIAAESGSKAFNLAGLKCALFVTASEPMTGLVESLPAEITYRTGLFGVLATTEGFAHSRDWLAGTIEAVEENLDLLQDQLDSRLPNVRMQRPRASYLAWLDMTELGLGDDPAAVLLKRAKVALSRGLDFGAPGAGYARMNVACAPETIVEAIDRIASAL